MRTQNSSRTEGTSHLHGDPENTLGTNQADHSAVLYQAVLGGDLSGLTGSLTGLTGSCKGLAGDVSLVQGDISRIKGMLDKQLVGEVSGLCGDVSNVWGNATGLRGQIAELVEKGLLWPRNRSFNLEMFATRYKLAMEFFDNSGMPALIGFHAVQGAPLHWLTVRDNAADGFVVGPLPEIARRFPGQEITKVAVPGDADWHISQDTRLIFTDRVYALEHIEPLFSSFTN